MRTKIFYSFVWIGVASLLIFYGAFFWLSAQLPYIPTDLRQLVYSQPTEIYADDGSLVHRLRGQSYVPLQEISQNFYLALVATEDARFFEHHGLDPIGLGRAAWSTVFRGRREGGSTLTQQLAKMLFFTYRREVSRKAKDMLVAVQLESMFSKQELLEVYANVVFFGGTAYGVEDASQQFFGKSAAGLSVSEGALLAGIINSPYAYNPYSNPSAARSRQRHVLRRMRAIGLLDEGEYEQALSDSLRFQRSRRSGNAFIDYVLTQASSQFGREAVQYGGLKIYTSIDPDLQRAAERAIRDGVARLEANLDSTGADLQAAMAVVSVPTGEVKAIVGGRNYYPGGFNRAVEANRHIGSGVKPFVYYAAMEAFGLLPNTVVYDTAIVFPGRNGTPSWRPRNFDRIHRGPLTLKSALMQSVNVIAAQQGARLTPRKMVQTLRRFGITSKIDENLSLSIGTSGVAPLEMAAAYSVFARDGVYYPPVTIRRVEDINGVVLYRALLRFGDQRLDQANSYMTLDMMRGVVEGGLATSRIIRGAGFTGPAAGKTGTSSDYTDAWFNGFTSSLSASVWVGYDKNHRMYRKNRRGVTGGYGAAPIWARFMRVASERYPARDFRVPDGLRSLRVHRDTGLPVYNPEQTIQVVLPEDRVPEYQSLDFNYRFPEDSTGRSLREN